MARLVLTPVQMPAKYPTLPITANSLDVVFTPAGADFADGAGFLLTGKEILIVLGGAAGGTVTISSTIDPYRRTADIAAYAVGVNLYSIFPQFQKAGWVQPDGQLYFAASAATVEFLVLRLTE